MGIGNRIKEARNNLGYTQEELAKLLGVTKGAVANYELETSHPKEPIMYKLIEVLNVDANYLFQDCVNVSKELNKVTLLEYEHIKKYRELDGHGKKMVDFTLQEEWERVQTKMKEQPPFHVFNEEPDYLAPAAAHNDAEQTQKELDLMRKDAERLKNL